MYNIAIEGRGRWQTVKTLSGKRNDWTWCPAVRLVFNDNRRVDAAANIEFCGDAHKARLAGGDQVVQNLVADRLVECTLVTERPDIKLECLELHTACVRYVLEMERCEVRLACLRAQTRKFRDLDADGVILPGAGVREGLEGLAGSRRHGGNDTQRRSREQDRAG